MSRARTVPVPNYPEKYDAPARFSPPAGGDDSAPAAVVLCPQDEFFAHAVAEHAGPELDAGGGATVHPLGGTDGRVGIAGGFGAGAPVTAAVVETLIAGGAEAVCVLGGCGGLGGSLERHDPVVVDRAIRDEGTSHHYLPDERYADATGALVDLLAAALADCGIDRRVGPTWTTDAIFRETTAELEHYRSEGVLTVEMEAAAVFAVATYRGADAGAVLSVFDRLLDDRWEDHDGGTVAGLAALLPPVRDALADHVRS